MALKDSYLGLITSQHKGKPKYMAMVETLLDPFDGAIETAVYFDDAFDLDLAAGAQQDILGDIIKQARALGFPYNKDGTLILDDTSYRAIQKAKIIRNLWNGEIGDLYEKWLILFGAPIRVQDNQDMTMAVLLDVDESDEMQKLMKLTAHGLIVPKPMGVKIKYHFYYPDIIMPIEIYQRAECMQIVESHHIPYNLGTAQRVRWDGKHCWNGKARWSGLHPDALYRTRQHMRQEARGIARSHQAIEIKQQMKAAGVAEARVPGGVRKQYAIGIGIAEPRQPVEIDQHSEATGIAAARINGTSDPRRANLWDSRFCWNGSHAWKGAAVRTGYLTNLCTIIRTKFGRRVGVDRV